MALTSAEKCRVVTLLGWPAKSVQPGSVLFNSIIDDRLKNLNVETEAKIRKFLSRVDKLDERLDCALDRIGAERVGDIKLNRDEMPTLRSERQRILRELAETTDIVKKSGGNLIGVIA